MRSLDRPVCIRTPKLGRVFTQLLKRPAHFSTRRVIEFQSVWLGAMAPGVEQLERGATQECAGAEVGKLGTLPWPGCFRTPQSRQTGPGYRFIV